MTSGYVTRCRTEADDPCRRTKTHQSKRITDRTYLHEADDMSGAELNGSRSGGGGTGSAVAGENLCDSKRLPPEGNPPINNAADSEISCSVAHSRSDAFPETEAGGDSTSTRRPTLDVPPSTTTTTRGNSASLSSNSSALTSASSGRTQMKVIYYQNRFIAIPIPAAPNARRTSDVTDNKNDDVTSGSVNPLADGDADDMIGAQFASQSYHPHHHPLHHNCPTIERRGTSREEDFQMDRKSYLVLRFIECLHDKDQQLKRTKTSKKHRSKSTLALVKCLNLFFLAMGILLFVGVLIAIAFSSVMQWLNVSH